MCKRRLVRRIDQHRRRVFNLNAEFGAGISVGNAEHSGHSLVIDAKIRDAYITSMGDEGATGIGSGTGASPADTISIFSGFFNVNGSIDDP
jgi:hypothetical protein